MMRGFGKTTGLSIAYPKNRLIKLLNLNLENEVGLENFCKEYNLFIVPINGSYTTDLKKLLHPLKEIVDYYISKFDLLPEHVMTINKHIRGISYELIPIDPKFINKMNCLLDPSPDSYNYIAGPIKKLYYAFVSRHINSVVSLWEEFAKYIVRGQQIQTCACCGKYFIPKKHSCGQKYCSFYCQDKYKKRRKRKTKLVPGVVPPQ